MTMLSKMTSEEQPDALCCPIGMTLMEDPVMLVETGHTYERQNIEAHSEVCTPQRSCAVYCRCATVTSQKHRQDKRLV